MHASTVAFILKQWADSEHGRHGQTFEHAAAAFRGMARSLDAYGFDAEAEGLFFLARLAITREAMKHVQIQFMEGAPEFLDTLYETSKGWGK